MPYGLPNELWAKLPPDDQAAIAATATGQPIPAIGGYTPTAATPAPPPTLTSGTSTRPTQQQAAPTQYPVATTVTTPRRAPVGQASQDGAWTLAAREAQVATVQDALAVPGARIPTQPGVTLIRAPIAAAPTLPPAAPAPAATPSSDPYATDALVPPGVRVPSGYLGQNVTLMTPPSSIQPPPTGQKNADQPTAATPAAPTGAEPNSSQPTLASVRPQRTLLGIPPPEEGPIGPEPFPEWLNGLKEALEATHYGEVPDNVSKAFQRWVERNWLGSPFTPAQLDEAFALAKTGTAYLVGKSVAEGFARANPPGTPNPFEYPVFQPDSASSLLRRAFAIQKELSSTTSQAAAARLEGALSAVGLVLAIVYPSALPSISYAGRYVGVGYPATSLEASLQDVLASVGTATRP